MILTQNQERIRFLKFAMVGAVGAVIDFGVMNMMTHLFNMKLVFAGTISFTCAVISNFILNRYWTYPDSRSKHILHQLGMFVIVSAAGIAFRIPILHYVEPPMAVFIGKVTRLPNETSRLPGKECHAGFCHWGCHDLELLHQPLLDV